jgi:hypothetical protein
VEWELYTDRWQLAAMLVFNKPTSRKDGEMSHSHSQWLNADQPPKKRVFMRVIAWVAMLSPLLSLVLLFILLFDFFYTTVAVDIVTVALGILVLILDRNDQLTRFLAGTGIIIAVAKYIVGFAILYMALSGGSLPVAPR